MVTLIPDTDPNDGATVEHFLFEGGKEGTVVEHFKVIDGGHDWFGSEGNMDINSSEEAWKFFSTYDIYGRMK